MDANDYQQKALGTAIYPRYNGIGLTYTVLGLNGETGEVAEKLKKYLRGGNDPAFLQRERSPQQAEIMAHELGDVLWYAACLAHELGYTLAEIMKMNVEKLASRQDRGVLHGEGDTR